MQLDRGSVNRYLIGILLVTRWGAGDMTATGGLFALDLVVTGWGLVGLSVTLKRLMSLN